MNGWAVSALTAVQRREVCLCDILRNTFGAVMDTKKPLRYLNVFGVVPLPKSIFVCMTHI